ncbi:small integral membrane protein 20 isoform X1 [Pseudopipra pipra]|uniref:small integral membrane protein 20 isoform X1 n=1 Tax=Pseudopipra pipra TaxID=415032 RepID=UPI0031399F22
MLLPPLPCPARSGVRDRPGDKDAADPASWRRGSRPGRAGQGPEPQVRSGRTGPAPAMLRGSRCRRAAPSSRRRAVSRERRARAGPRAGPRPPSRRLRGGPRAPPLPGASALRCQRGRGPGQLRRPAGGRGGFRAGRRDRGSSLRAARAAVTARRERHRHHPRTAPLQPRGGAAAAPAPPRPRPGPSCPACPGKAPGRDRRAMAGLSRTLGIFGAFAAVVGAAFYPIYFRPLLLPEEYMCSWTSQIDSCFGPCLSSDLSFHLNIFLLYVLQERTINKPSWYCSRGYSACRVKSVV